jgi:hypothetical protein
MLEIIIFAIVAAFLFFKLKSILGKEDDNTQGVRSGNFANSIKNITISAKEVDVKTKEQKQVEAEEEIKKNLTLFKPELESAYREISSTSPNGFLNLKNFFSSVEDIFSELIKARNTKTLSNITFSLSKDVASILLDVFKSESLSNPNQKIELVKIEAIEIEDMKAIQGDAFLKVKISSSQIRYSKEGENITSGSITIPHQFIDHFTITRILKDKLYIWTLTSIE